MNHRTTKIALLLVVFSLGATACDLAMQGQASLPDVSQRTTSVTPDELQAVKFIQCYSNDISVTFDLSLEELSPTKKFVSASAEMSFKDPRLSNSFGDRSGRTYLGFPETGYFYQKDTVAGVTSYVLEQNYEKPDGSYNFEIEFVSHDYVRGTGHIELRGPYGTRVIETILSCYAK